MKVLCLALAMTTAVSPTAFAASNEMLMCGHLADAWKAAYNGKDAGKVVALYDATSGLYSNPFWTAHGREELVRGFEADFAMKSKFDTITCDAAQSQGKMLMAWGTYTASAEGPDGTMMPINGHWFASAKDQGDGKYAMATHNANMQMPPHK